MDRVKNRRFKDKSKWVPEANEPMLDLFLKNLEFELFSIKESGQNYSNLSYLERRALRNLKESSDIVIKKADKGSAVVVWGLEEYRKEAYRHLKDEKVYEKVLDNPLNKTRRRVGRSHWPVSTSILGAPGLNSTLASRSYTKVFMIFACHRNINHTVFTSINAAAFNNFWDF